MPEILKAIRNISLKHSADVYIFSGRIIDDSADKLINEIRETDDKMENCVVILTTNGGDPDAGYRMIRSIKNHYKKFILYVFGFCKSTGTLIAVGADEIYMGELAEFGPLDIQMPGGDDGNTSGLSYLQSLISLNERIYASFEQNFMELKGFGITTKTAAEIGSKLAIGIIQPIAGQIDPLKLGEVQRSIKIADSYAERIKGQDNAESVKKLIGNYPSHSFVIDFEEMKVLFKNKTILRPDKETYIIEKHLKRLVRKPSKEDVVFRFELEEDEEKSPNKTETAEDIPANAKNN